MSFLNGYLNIDNPLLVQVGIALVIGLLVSQLAGLVITVYLHRGLTHRGVTYHPLVGWCFSFLLWITTGTNKKKWIAVHLKHHAKEGTEEDPHSPEVMGWKYIQLHNTKLYRQAGRDPRVLVYAKDYKTTWWDRYFFDHGTPGLVIGTGILVLLVGPFAGLLGALLHSVLIQQGLAAVNSIGHTFGRKPYRDKVGTNVWWLALLTAGEGQHNNHHCVPTSPKLWHRWYEIDLGWPVIRALTIVRLARVREGALRRVKYEVDRVKKLQPETVRV